MKIFTHKRLQTIARIFLCAYVLLLCEEIIHHDLDGVIPQTVTINNGDGHFAHRIITEKAECPICQGTYAQISTTSFCLTSFSVSALIDFTPPTHHPGLARVRHFSLRAPPLSA